MPTESDSVPDSGLTVVDSSALVTVLIDPGERGAALASRLTGARLCAPHVLPFEVANVLRRRRNAGLLSSGEAALAFSGFNRMPVELWPFAVLAEQTWAHGANLSSYDVSYVALAERLQCTLITRDAKLARAPGLACQVEVFA